MEAVPDTVGSWLVDCVRVFVTLPVEVWLEDCDIVDVIDVVCDTDEVKV